MTSIPKITKNDVTRWTNSTYFQRGQNYYNIGAIYNQRSQGMSIKSQCSGSQAGFYRQEVEFSNKGIKNADCSCPIGGGGYCKHAVALLLTWVNDPDSFTEMESLDSSLEKRSKAELIAIIKEMLEQEPELSSLLELPLLAESNQPLDLKAIHRQAEQAFHGNDYEWGYAREIKKSLNPLLNIASVYLANGNAGNAASVHAIVIESILDEQDMALGDDEGSLLGVIYDCSEALGQCLDTISDGQQRSDILEVLFSAYRWDVMFAGGCGAADCVPDILVKKTNSDERAEIAEWTRGTLPKGDGWSANYHREVWGRLLLELEADILDDEAYLKICRETGRLNDLVKRLLDLKRIEEVKETARDAKDYDLWKTLDIFKERKQTLLAEELVSERLNRIEDSRLLEWLSKRYEESGNLAGALELEKRLFWERPRVEKYEQLCELGKQIERWEHLRTKIIVRLESEKKFDLLVEIYLFEKDVKKALLTLEKVKIRHWGGNALRIEVAKASKEKLPHESICIFVEEAERFITRRGRDNYAEAAQYLYEVRDTYRQMNDMQTWEKFMAGLRENYRKLPALQDELNKMKL